MPSALEASTKANYSRSQWGSLSIQDRIRAMNQQLDATPAASLVVQTASLSEDTPLNPPSLEPPSSADSSSHNLRSPSAQNSPSVRKRSSVVDIWRQREAGGGSSSVAASKADSVDSRSNAKEVVSPPSFPIMKPIIADEEKKDDEENTKPKSKNSDLWGKPSRSAARPVPHHDVKHSNEAAAISNSKMSSHKALPVAREAEPPALVILPPKANDTVKSNSHKVAGRWNKRQDLLETEQQPDLPEKLPEPKVEPVAFAVQPKRSRVLDMWMKRAAEPTSASTNDTAFESVSETLPRSSKHDAPSESFSEVKPKSNKLDKPSESIGEGKPRSSSKRPALPNTTSDSIDAAKTANVKRAVASGGTSNKFVAGSRDEAKIERVGRTLPSTSSTKDLTENRDEAEKSDRFGSHASANHFFAASSDKDKSRNRKVKRTDDLADSASFVAWSKDEAMARNLKKLDSLVKTKPDPPEGFEARLRSLKRTQPNGSHKLRPPGSNDEVKSAIELGKQKLRAVTSKRFETPPPSVPNNSGFSEQNARKPSPEPSARFSPFQTHSPSQSQFGLIEESPTPKEAKKFWEIKAFQSLSQDKAFQTVDWPTLESNDRSDEEPPRAKRKEVKSSAAARVKSRPRQDRKQSKTKGGGIEWQGNWQADDPAWQDDGPTWQADAPLWQDDAKVWQGAWPDEAPVWSDDGDIWPEEAPVLSDDFNIAEESKVWPDDAKFPINGTDSLSDSKGTVDGKDWSKDEVGGSGQVWQVAKKRTVSPVKQSEHVRKVPLKKLDTQRRSEDPGLNDKRDVLQDKSLEFAGSVARGYEASDSPVIYKVPNIANVSPFKPISPVVAIAEKQLETPPSASKVDDSNGHHKVLHPQVRSIASVLALPSLYPVANNDDGHEQSMQNGRDIPATSVQLFDEGSNIPSDSEVGEGTDNETELFQDIPEPLQELLQESELLHADPVESALTDHDDATAKLPVDESRDIGQTNSGVVASSGKLVRRRMLSERRRWVTPATDTTTRQNPGIVRKSSAVKETAPTFSARFSRNALSKKGLSRHKTHGPNEAVSEKGAPIAEPFSAFSAKDSASSIEPDNEVVTASELRQRPIEKRSKRAIPSPLKLRSQSQSLTKEASIALIPKSPERRSVDSSERPILQSTAPSALPATSPSRVSRFFTRPSKSPAKEKLSGASVGEEQVASEASKEPLPSTPPRRFFGHAATSPLRTARLAFQTVKSQSPGTKPSDAVGALPDSLKHNPPLPVMPTSPYSALTAARSTQQTSSKPDPDPTATSPRQRLFNRAISAGVSGSPIRPISTKPNLVQTSSSPSQPMSNRANLTQAAASPLQLASNRVDIAQTATSPLQPRSNIPFSARTATSPLSTRGNFVQTTSPLANWAISTRTATSPVASRGNFDQTATSPLQPIAIRANSVRMATSPLRPVLNTAQTATSPLQSVSYKANSAQTSPLRASIFSSQATNAKSPATLPSRTAVETTSIRHELNLSHDKGSRVVGNESPGELRGSLNASTAKNQVQNRGKFGRVDEQSPSTQENQTSNRLLIPQESPGTTQKRARESERLDAPGITSVSAQEDKISKPNGISEQAGFAPCVVDAVPSPKIGTPGALSNSLAFQSWQRRSKVTQDEEAGVKSISVTTPSVGRLSESAGFHTPTRPGASPLASFARKDFKLPTSGTPERPKSAEPRSFSTPKRNGESAPALPSSADRPARLRRTILKPDPRRFNPGFKGSNGATKVKQEMSVSPQMKTKIMSPQVKTKIMSPQVKITAVSPQVKIKAVSPQVKIKAVSPQVKIQVNANPKVESGSVLNGVSKPSSSLSSLTPETKARKGSNISNKVELDERSPVQTGGADDDSWSFDELTIASSVVPPAEKVEMQANMDLEQETQKRTPYQETFALADSSESSRTEQKLQAPSFTTENAVVLPDNNFPDDSSQQTRRKTLSIEVENSSYAGKEASREKADAQRDAPVLPNNVGTAASVPTTNSKLRAPFRVQQKKRLETRFKMPLSPSTKSDAGASDTNLSIFSGASSAFSGWSTASGLSKGSQSALSSRAGKVLQGRRRQKPSPKQDHPAKQEPVELDRTSPVAQETRNIPISPTPFLAANDAPPSAEESRPTLASLYNRTSRFIEEASQATANVFTDTGALAALRVQGLKGSAFASPRNNTCTTLDVDQASIQAGSRTNSFASDSTESSAEEVQSNASSIPSWTSPDPRLVPTFCSAVQTHKIPCKEACEPAKRRSTADTFDETASSVDAFQNAYQSINLKQLAHNISETVGVKAMDLHKLANEFKHGLSGGGPVKGQAVKRNLKMPQGGENYNDEEVAIEVEYIEENSDDSYDEDSEEDEIQSSGDVGRQASAPLKVDTSFSKELLDGESEQSISPAGQPSHESGLGEARRQHRHV